MSALVFRKPRADTEVGPYNFASFENLGADTEVRPYNFAMIASVNWVVDALPLRSAVSVLPSANTSL